MKKGIAQLEILPSINVPFFAFFTRLQIIINNVLATVYAKAEEGA